MYVGMHEIVHACATMCMHEIVHAQPCVGHGCEQLSYILQFPVNCVFTHASAAGSEPQTYGEVREDGLEVYLNL